MNKLKTPLILLCWMVGMALPASAQPTSHPSKPVLPPPDPVVQQWLGELLLAPDPYKVQAPRIVEARLARRLTDEQLLMQSLIFLSGIEGPERLGMEDCLRDMCARYLAFGGFSWTKVLAPYLEHEDRAIATVAGELIQSSGVLRPDRSGADMLWIWEFSSIESYLTDLGDRDPAWRLVEAVYLVDPDAALRTTTRVYLKSGEPLWQAERAQREFKVLLLSLYLAIAERKMDVQDELNKKMTAKLAEMAEHPHWCVRAYAIATISRSIPYAIGWRDMGWVWDTSVTEKLMKDSNPFISRLATETLERIDRARRTTPLRDRR